MRRARHPQGDSRLGTDRRLEARVMTALGCETHLHDVQINGQDGGWVYKRAGRWRWQRQPVTAGTVEYFSRCSIGDIKKFICRECGTNDVRLIRQ